MSERQDNQHLEERLRAYARTPEPDRAFVDRLEQKLLASDRAGAGGRRTQRQPALFGVRRLLSLAGAALGVLLLLAVAGLFAGWFGALSQGGTGEPVTGSRPPATTATAVLERLGDPLVASARNGDLLLEARLPQERYLPGEGGQAQVILTNEGTEPLQLDPGCETLVCPVLADEAVRAVDFWPWEPLAAPVELSLAPGETRVESVPFQIPPSLAGQTVTLGLITRISQPVVVTGEPAQTTVEHVFSPLQVSLTLQVAAAAPDRQLTATLAMDRDGWQLQVRGAAGAVPPGPPWALLEVNAEGRPLVYRLQNEVDGQWAARWPEGLEDAAKEARAWVAAPGYVLATVTAFETAPASTGTPPPPVSPTPPVASDFPRHRDGAVLVAPADDLAVPQAEFLRLGIEVVPTLSSLEQQPADIVYLHPRSFGDLAAESLQALYDSGRTVVVLNVPLGDIDEKLPLFREGDGRQADPFNPAQQLMGAAFRQEADGPWTSFGVYDVDRWWVLPHTVEMHLQAATAGPTPPGPHPSPTPDLAGGQAGWLVYENDTFAYSFSYPPQAVLEEGDGCATLYLGGAFLQVVPSEQEACRIGDNGDYEVVLLEDHVTVAGRELWATGYEMHEPGDEGAWVGETFTVVPGNGFTITYGTRPGGEVAYELYFADKARLLPVLETLRMEQAQ